MEAPRAEPDKKAKTKHLQLAVLGLLLCFGASFLWDLNNFTIPGFLGFWALVAGVFITVKHSVALVRSFIKK